MTFKTGWSDAYGRHGLFTSYEGFTHVADSMFNQHAKWLEMSRGVSWRRPIASLNYLLTSHAWHQYRNGLTHQNPGFIGLAFDKKPGIANVYLPPDANTLLAVADHCLRSRDAINVIVAGNQPAPQWLDIDSAAAHAKAGISIWDWASGDRGAEPDLVIAAAGDVPTIEALAAVDYLRRRLPQVQIRFVNVIDLGRLQDPDQNPAGLPHAEYDAMFTREKPVIFVFHGYASLIHSLLYSRHNHNVHVRAFMEEGDVTTPFDIRVKNEIDRFHLVDLAILLIGGSQGGAIHEELERKLLAHHRHVSEFGEDLPEIREWIWEASR
jgi:xylulose-5-phosphate/fructose-6-phosphate phosphoketolase